MTVETYLSPTTNLPNRLGEIFSDRSTKVYGQARLIGTTQIQTSNLRFVASPIDGGSESFTIIPDGTYTIPDVGGSLWGKLRRTAGSSTLTLGVDLLYYAAGVQPKPSQNWIQIFYRMSSTEIIAPSGFIISVGATYTRFGGANQAIFEAIVGNDASSTHSDLQAAINDVSTNSWILVKKVCSVVSTLVTSGKVIKLLFSGTNTGISSGGATTGVQLSVAGCQLVGNGTISGFTTGINLNGQTGTRLEMNFSGNTTNITSQASNTYNAEGSVGLNETAHIEMAPTDGLMARWNSTKQRWEPINNIGGKTVTCSSGGTITISSTGGVVLTIASNGVISTTGTLQAAAIVGPLFLRRPDLTLREVAINNDDNLEIYSI